MKTSKKILAAVLAISMVVSVMFTSTVAFADTTAGRVVVTNGSFESIDAGTEYLKGGTIKVVDPMGDIVPVTGKTNYTDTLAVRSAADNGGSVVVKGGSKTDTETNNYIEVTYPNLGFNHRAENTLYDSIGYSDYPVLHAGYDIQIPADTPYKENTRKMMLVSGTTATTSSYNSNPLKTHVNLTDGLLTAYDEKINSPTVSGGTIHVADAYKYTYGEWVTVNVYVWVSDEKAIDVAVFVGDELIYWGTRTASSAISMATGAIEFYYYNKKDNSGNLASTDETITVKSVTNYDDIIVELLPLSTVANISTAKRPEDVVLAPNMYQFAYVKSSNVTTSSDALNRTVKPAKSGKLFETVGTTPSSGITQSSSTKGAEPSSYTLGFEDSGTQGREYLDITASATRNLVLTNSRESFRNLVAEGTNTFVYDADIQISEGSEGIRRALEVTLGLDLDQSGSDTTTSADYNPYRRITNDFSIGAYYKDGKIYFDTGSKTYGSPVPGAERTESRAVASNTWHNVKCIMEITHEDTQYHIKSYGVCNGELIYVNEDVITYTDYNKDGISDDLGVNQFTIDIPSNDGTIKYTTRYDGMTLVKDNNFNWAGIDTEAWTAAETSLKKDANGNVVVSAKSANNNKFATGILLIAICGEDGLVNKVVTSADLKDFSATKNGFEYTVPASDLAGAKTVKAFVLDGITTAKPISVNGVINLK